MSEAIKHECGVAMIRLLKPLEFYQMKYGNWQYGLQKLYLLMEKQHNRGQEGAGMACVKLDMQPGYEYINRERALGSQAIDACFASYNQQYAKYTSEQVNDPGWAKENLPFAGEVLMGHLRYSTTGKEGLQYVHPFLRRNNWKSRNLCICGNFNLTNVSEMSDRLIEKGQHPRDMGDTFLMLETLGHYLDREVQKEYDKLDEKGIQNIAKVIEEQINIPEVLRKSSSDWDGGYTICGLMGHGDAFAFRDPWGIRPAFWYADDEIVVVTSERPVIQTVMNVSGNQVKELEPGKALIIKKNGRIFTEQIREAFVKKSCSFERIYFSRGSDEDIYKERKKLGALLTQPILKAVNYDIENTVFSYIPNTAEVAFFGMSQGLEHYVNDLKKDYLKKNIKNLDENKLNQILALHPRLEKVAIKDIKLRTFIAQQGGRNDLAAHVYDVTWGSLRPYEDNLVIIDDSIVRGTTLKQSIIKILDRLHPKKIVVVSSSPQVRYPDCYGIDMSRMSEFIAFKAAIQLLRDNHQEKVLNEVYNKIKAQQLKPKEDQTVNYVKDIYKPFTVEQISDKIAEMLTPEETKAKIQLVYQYPEDLIKACPNHTGDWYFTGNYPTPGGIRLVNQAFINYIEGVDIRVQ
ncbi:MAG: amidophosphoribosyltransferase [Bacteroidales bacterium]|nr:amidophosphoribosyltransferase [Bacteroidales bacterium]MDD3907152.1 amidophosphoribosyltransferase [Bacteroidales bacterium]MDD4712305.1 amidophosphoribosyltransferase [Bacteroidales bacterium]